MLIELSIVPRGFTASELAEKVRHIFKSADKYYTPRQASYDLKKFRGKDLVARIVNTRRYEVMPSGLKKMAAFITLKNKVLMPLLARIENSKSKKTSKSISKKYALPIDVHYKNIQCEMESIFEHLKIAA